LTERVATLSCLSLDHYESTHDECDNLFETGAPAVRCAWPVVENFIGFAT
jgi:hypothetical protein